MLGHVWLSDSPASDEIGRLRACWCRRILEFAESVIDGAERVQARLEMTGGPVCGVLSREFGVLGCEGKEVPS